MDNSPETDSFQIYVMESQRRTGHSFTVLCFGTLALSVQFSPAMGQVFPYLLVASWCLLLLSGLAGGWRLIQRDLYYTNNVDHNELKDLITINRNVLNELNAEMVMVPDFQREVNLDRTTKLEETLDKQQASLDRFVAVMTNQNKTINHLFQAQMGLYLLGLLGIMVFTSVNYLFLPL